jgi:integrase
MATIRARTGRNGDVTHTAMVRIAGYPTRTETFPSKRDAERWATKVEAEMLEGRHSKDTSGRKRNLGEAIDRYLAEVLPLKKDGSMYRFTLRWWKEKHGEKKLGEISRGWLASARAELLTGTFTRATLGSKRSEAEAAEAFQRSPATANRYMAALSHVFTMICGDWEWLQPGQNPFAGLSKLKEAKGRTRHLSDEEKSRLMAETVKDTQLHVLVCVALATAARAGELVGLKWSQVQISEDGTEGRLLLLDTKNGEDRMAWVFGDALLLLRDHKARNMRIITGKGEEIPASDVVFPGQWSHKGQTFGVYDYMPRFRKALDAAKIQNFRFHDLRHTALTGLARMGTSNQQLKAISGHKSSIVDRYIHIAAQDIKGKALEWAKKVGQK